MKLGGQMDYHGSRASAPDPPSVTSESWVKRLAGPFTAWATYMLEMLLKPGARQAAETMWLVHGEERHFSVLGADHDGNSGVASLRRPGPLRKRRFGCAARSQIEPTTG